MEKKRGGKGILQGSVFIWAHEYDREVQGPNSHTQMYQCTFMSTATGPSQELNTFQTRGPKGLSDVAESGQNILNQSASSLESLWAPNPEPHQASPELTDPGDGL